VLRALFAAALVVFLQGRGRGAQADARGATHVLDRGCRPLPAAPLVVRYMFMAVVPRPMPAAVVSRCCRRRFRQLACVCGTKSRRGAQADARGATQLLDRGAQAVARGAARCLLYVLDAKRNKAPIWPSHDTHQSSAP
jgi:hypothetical protein